MTQKTFSGETSFMEYTTTCPAAKIRPQVESLESALHELLVNVLRKGFYGTAGISITINDGVIQHIRSQTEQVRKCNEKC